MLQHSCFSSQVSCYFHLSLYSPMLSYWWFICMPSYCLAWLQGFFPISYCYLLSISWTDNLLALLYWIHWDAQLVSIHLFHVCSNTSNPILLDWLFPFTFCFIWQLVGGVDRMQQVISLGKRPHIVVSIVNPLSSLSHSKQKIAWLTYLYRQFLSYV